MKDNRNNPANENRDNQNKKNNPTNVNQGNQRNNPDSKDLNRDNTNNTRNENGHINNPERNDTRRDNDLASGLNREKNENWEKEERNNPSNDSSKHRTDENGRKFPEPDPIYAKGEQTNRDKNRENTGLINDDEDEGSAPDSRL